MTDTREQFEAHFDLTERQLKRDNYGDYTDPYVQHRWVGWQRAMAVSAKDAARLNWLQTQSGATLHEPVFMPGAVSESTSWLIVDGVGDSLGEGATLRDAIDAAMQERA